MIITLDYANCFQNRKLEKCLQLTFHWMLWLLKAEHSGPSTRFLRDLCDLLESFSWSVCSAQDRGDITSTNESRKKGFSLVLGSMVDPQKTHGWPFPAYGELLTFLFTVVPNEKLRTMVSVMRSTPQFACCYISALFWNKDAIRYKPITDNTAQFLQHLQIVGMNLDTPSADGESVQWCSLPQRHILIYCFS